MRGEVPKFVPLSDIDRVTPTPKMRIDGVFPPYVDPREIGIGLRGINALCRLGGIRRLQVVGVSGDVSTVTPEIGGMDSHGNAIASLKSTVTKVPAHSGSFQPSNIPDNILSASIWVNATVEINTREIEERIRNANEKNGVRSNKAWSREVNQALRAGIVEVGLRHLLLDHSQTDVLAFGLVTTFQASAIALGLMPSRGLVVPFIAAAGDLLTHVVDNLGNERDEDRYRHSAFAGYQFDRAALLALRGKSTKVVKALKPDKKELT